MSDQCQHCKKPEPAEGWYMVGGPAPLEFYCSAACLDYDLNGDPEHDYDPGEECDWDCPYSR